MSLSAPAVVLAVAGLAFVAVQGVLAASALSDSEIVEAVASPSAIVEVSTTLAPSTTSSSSSTAAEDSTTSTVEPPPLATDPPPRPPASTPSTTTPTIPQTIPPVTFPAPSVFPQPTTTTAPTTTTTEPVTTTTLPPSADVENPSGVWLVLMTNPTDETVTFTITQTIGTPVITFEVPANSTVSSEGRKGMVAQSGDICTVFVDGLPVAESTAA